jgi:hypothetical protein
MEADYVTDEQLHLTVKLPVQRDLQNFINPTRSVIPWMGGGCHEQEATHYRSRLTSLLSHRKVYSQVTDKRTPDQRIIPRSEGASRDGLSGYCTIQLR